MAKLSMEQSINKRGFKENHGEIRHEGHTMM